jgi:PAS domain S-box-containing protein
MSSLAQNYDQLIHDYEELQARLNEAEELVNAIRAGSIDALMVEGPQGSKVYTLEGADQPYRIFVENMNEGAVTLARDGSILYTNRQFSQLTGGVLEQTIGYSFYDFVADGDQEICAAWLRDRRNDSRIEIALKDSAGILVPVRLSARPMVLGNDEFICLVVTDLRGQKLQEQLRDADRRKDEFLAMLGHELRNPLAIMHNVLQIMRKKNGADGNGEMRGMIEQQVRHMGRLIDDLLDISRVSTGKIRLENARFDLTQVVADTVQGYRDSLEENGLTLTLELPNRQLFVHGDKTRIAQVIGNLLHNASKFTDSGGKVAVTLKADESAKKASIHVSDTGIGMESETLEHAFDSFTQADHSIARSRGGLGLGLALVKGLIEMHSGAVEALSNGAGQGSEFIVRLPIDTSAADTPDQEAPNGKNRGRSFRILVIEDNQAGALSMQMLLNQLGHVSEVAFDGVEGLAAAARFKPEVVLCDIGLPGFNGYQIAQQLRQREDGRRVFLMALSGYGQEENKRLALEAGFDIHCVKPLKIDMLEKLLAEL